MKRKNLIVLFLFLLVGFLAYSNSLNNRFVFSDHYLITENYLIRDFKFIPFYFKGYLSQDVKGVFRPLTMASYNLNYLLNETHVYGYRIFNILIHSLNVFLIYLLLLALFPRGSKRAAVVAALIYLLHPINAEAVNHLMGRSVLLLTLFVLNSFYFFVKSSGTGNKKLTVLAFIGFIFALISKENASLYIGVVFLYLLLFKQMSIKRSVFKCGLFVFPASILLIYWKIYSLAVFFPRSVSIQYSSWFLNFLTQFKVLFLYLRLFILPMGFSFDHEYLRVTDSLDLSAWVCLGMICLVLFFVARANRKIKFFVFWLGCFYAWRFFIQLESVAREHHFYLPQVGLICGVYLALDFTFKRNRLLSTLFFIIPVFLGGLTYSRNVVWRDEVSISLDVLNIYPESEIANYQIGLKLRQDKRYQDAIESFKNIVSSGSNPQLEVKSLVNISEIYLDIGNTHKSLNVAKSILAKYPDIRTPYILLEKIYLLNADMQFDELLVEFPQNRNLFYYLADYWFRKGDHQKAEIYLIDALNSGLDISGVYCLLGRIKEEQGLKSLAASYYKKALLQNYFNKEASFYLGTILAQDHSPKGGYFLKKSVQIDPRFSAGHYNLGLFYLGQESRKQAFFHLRKAELLGYLIPDNILEILNEKNVIGL
ncbi:MAG: hypothetical protein P9M06_01160 [Candidatus Saelkia tenebricola]|nr:hypothetical protein [Candidatus Saelkia tenebricola]